MQVRLTKDGWRIDLRPEIQAALEFVDKTDAEDFMDLVDSGMIPKEALLKIIDRREEAKR